MNTKKVYPPEMSEWDHRLLSGEDDLYIEFDMQLYQKATAG